MKVEEVCSKRVAANFWCVSVGVKAAMEVGAAVAATWRRASWAELAATTGRGVSAGLLLSLLFLGNFAACLGVPFLGQFWQVNMHVGALLGAGVGHG